MFPRCAQLLELSAPNRSAARKCCYSQVSSAKKPVFPEHSRATSLCLCKLFCFAELIPRVSRVLAIPGSLVNWQCQSSFALASLRSAWDTQHSTDILSLLPSDGRGFVLRDMLNWSSLRAGCLPERCGCQVWAAEAFVFVVLKFLESRATTTRSSGHEGGHRNFFLGCRRIRHILMNLCGQQCRSTTVVFRCRKSSRDKGKQPGRQHHNWHSTPKKLRRAGQPPKLFFSSSTLRTRLSWIVGTFSPLFLW